MRLVTFEGDRIGKVVGDSIVDLSALVPGAGTDPMIRLIERWETLRAEAEQLAGPALPLDSARLEAPVPRPGKVIAAPVNYANHKEEMKQVGDVSHLGFFLKAPSSVLRPGGTIQLPYTDRRFDNEGELALVIGRRCRHVSEAEALEVVFGYTCLLDITMRGGEDRSTRKSFDTFTPFGPWLVTPDEFGDPTDAELTCSVNGQLRQKANTGELIWGVAKLIAYYSSVMTLEPGDVISTGTPAGVAPIEAGDEVVAAVSGIGALTVGVAADYAGTCPTLGAGSGPVPPPPVPDGPAARGNASRDATGG
jgi:2-keto-4-pentenoate hydratase/2-oxohepta-3-ene-1,7-dioic acid hydratase in catechol pathway